MAMDLRGVNRLIKSGDIGGATQLLQNRLGTYRQTGRRPDAYRQPEQDDFGGRMGGERLP